MASHLCCLRDLLLKIFFCLFLVPWTSASSVESCLGGNKNAFIVSLTLIRSAKRTGQRQTAPGGCCFAKTCSWPQCLQR
jgi:hypothetical protein